WSDATPSGAVTAPGVAVPSVAVSSSDPRTVYVDQFLGTTATPGQETLYVTHDAGATWQHLTPGGDGGAYKSGFVVDPLHRSELWAMTGSVTVIHSTDGGQTWKTAKTFS